MNNDNSKLDLPNAHSLPADTNVLAKAETLKGSLDDALKVTGTYKVALENEVRARTMLEYQLAAAVEQEGGARDAALRDVLTGLPNRALFYDRLEHSISQATRHNWTLVVMFVDLDKFKCINDSYGHAAGDFVLQTIATRLAEITRQEDTVSRVGGDEFLFLLTEIQDEDQIAKVAAKILASIHEPCQLATGEIDVNLSIEASVGISIFPKDGATSTALIGSADTAMYTAKRTKAGFSFAQ